jgi:hypothetical protein
MKLESDMKMYRFVTISLAIVLALAIVSPVIVLLANPGSTMFWQGYLSFLFPGLLLFALLLLLPRVAKLILNWALLGGAVAILLCVFFFQFSPVALFIYILGATGLLISKNFQHSNPPR